MTSLFADDVTEAFNHIRRNPVVKAFDRTDADPAKNWRSHLADANAVAQGLDFGDIFTTIQRAKTSDGFWVTEWTVGGTVSMKEPTRRRAGRGKTIAVATADMLQHPSYNDSHFFGPADGVRGWYKRNFG